MITETYQVAILNKNCQVPGLVEIMSNNNEATKLKQTTTNTTNSKFETFFIALYCKYYIDGMSNICIKYCNNGDNTLQ